MSAAIRWLALRLLALAIQREAEAFARANPGAVDHLHEPYRAAGDRLVDAALEYVP